MKKVSRLLIFFFAMVLLLAGGCAVEEAAGEKGPVTIGVILPLSGKDQIPGERMLAGLRHAEYELNTHRGINNRQVRLLVFDSAGKPDESSAAFLTAVRSGVKGVICGGNEEEILAAAPLAQQHKMPLLVLRETADSVVGINPFVYRSIYSDTQQSETLAAYLWYWRQMLRISVLMDDSPDASYERNTARAVAGAFREFGGSVTSTPVYRGKDFKKAVTDALITGPQAVIVSARGERAAAIVTELRKKGYKGAVCGLDGWDQPEFFKALTALGDPGDCVYISLFTPTDSIEEFNDFRADFRRRNFHEPGNLETIGYDALKLLAIGLGQARNAGDFNKNWLSIRNHFGAAGTYTMLRKGKIDRTMFINAVDPAKGNISGCQGRLLRSFMHSRLATYKY